MLQRLREGETVLTTVMKRNERGRLVRETVFLTGDMKTEDVIVHKRKFGEGVPQDQTAKKRKTYKDAGTQWEFRDTEEGMYLGLRGWYEGHLAKYPASTRASTPITEAPGLNPDMWASSVDRQT